MIKFISGVVLGVFVGAVAAEVFERQPELIAKIRQKARRVGDKVRERAAQIEDSVGGFGARDTDKRY